jgi:predicted AlkP superfamily phosphohydrolase/phosphomutase
LGQRVLVIGLDGHEPSVGTWLDSHSALPALAALRARSARFLLDHGNAVRTGLAWEHFATGLSPDDAGKWAAVAFDPASYRVWQDGTSLTPFPARLAARTVVFDPPYFDLGRAPSVRGVVAWGAHDPGVELTGTPNELLAEMARRGWHYPAMPYIYGLPWPSMQVTRAMGEHLAKAVSVRSRAARWLLAERLPDWDLGIVVVSELHSAIEGLWYGIDTGHPLNAKAASSKIAGRGLLEVYRRVDALVADFVAAFPDATIVGFTMNGMGPNHSDNASMVLLPELLHRWSFRRGWLRAAKHVADGPAELPMLAEDEGWGRVVQKLVPPPEGFEPFVAEAGGRRLSLDWMPAARYRPFWPRMPAFALPSFYDGRIRINLAGREAQGIVQLQDYEAVRSEVEELLRACRDSITGVPVVKHIDRPTTRDPLALHATEADLVVVWNGPTLGLDHPRWGRIGPLPYRRPGGHTGPYGMAYIAGEGIVPGDYGVRSSFDMAPTVVELLGEGPVAGMSGTSMLGPNRSMAPGRLRA